MSESPRIFFDTTCREHPLSNPVFRTRTWVGRRRDRGEETPGLRQAREHVHATIGEELAPASGVAVATSEAAVVAAQAV